MWCAGCAYMVKETLSDVEGVRGIEVSARRKDAIVTFEDTETDVATLLAATSGAGFPSTVIE
jgi:mercuric ion binding protein